ncbi:uncharacterized protein [Battus philenor]|uniref:uncharacterized protein isoform X1 n=1 Tax=Battus philenor TaxID=42288 RepID=UPI0035CF8522
MARTKASVGAKVALGKSSKARNNAAPPPRPGPSGMNERSKSHGGGNPVCPRETPVWQKPITKFFNANNSNNDSDSEGVINEVTVKPDKTNPEVINVDETDKEGINGSKQNQINSVDEDNLPKNYELDESLCLEPLTGENSHKIEEYYHKSNKGKGKGKKSKTKNGESEREEKSLKRDIEEVNFGEESDQVSKKAKLK